MSLILVKKGERVLDSFNGGGSTLMVCEKTERIYYGMELDPVYVERTIKRWEEETGLKAEKINWNDRKWGDGEWTKLETNYWEK